MASTTFSKKQFIDIHISGCVRKHQKPPHKLLLGSTVRDAIKKAGGFRKEPYPPSGIISIRSKRLRDGKYYCRRKLNYKRWPKLLSLMLKDGDMVVVQYDVSSGANRVIPTGLFA
jgi:major membrane immunogen (membrane-anchored lipoprotein)